MNIKGVYLPNWLAVFLLSLLALMMYFVLDPVNQMVNGVLMSLFGPLIEAFGKASSLSVM